MSAVIFGISGQRVKFISNCEDNIRITKTYFVLGMGLTVGFVVSVWGGTKAEDESKGYFGTTNVFKDEPKPITENSISGPSAGMAVKSGTLASASLDFNSFAEVYGDTSGKSLGASLFNFSGERYFHINTITEDCCE